MAANFELPSARFAICQARNKQGKATDLKILLPLLEYIFSLLSQYRTIAKTISPLDAITTQIIPPPAHIYLAQFISKVV